MSERRLPHYVRHHRKRVGLSQDELAALLGAKCGTKVSRYERFSREPSLVTAFAYQVLFGVPASELLAGTFGRVREATLARAATLLDRLKAEPRSASHPGRRAWLRQLEQEIATVESA